MTSWCRFPAAHPTHAAAPGRQPILRMLSCMRGWERWSGADCIAFVRSANPPPQHPGARPTVALHYASFSMEPPRITVRSVVLIDDVVTRGRTLLAAASRVQEAFPEAHVRAFALLRTRGLVPGLQQLLDPCRGEIRWKAGEAYRRP